MQHDAPRCTLTTVSGSTTALFEFGPETGPPVLAIHGFRGTHMGLAPLGNALASRGYRVLVPDLPGSGVSTPLVGQHDTAGYAAWLEGLIPQLGEPPVVLGHSFGSVIVAAALARGPLVRGAVLVNPILTPPLSGPYRAATSAARAYYALARRLPNALGRSLLGNRTIAEIGGAFMTSSTDPVTRRWIRREHRRQANAFSSREVVLESFKASTTATVTDFAHAVTCPTLVLAARRDPLAAPAEYTPDKSGLPHGTFHVFPDRGHLLPFEAPRESAGLIAAWDRNLTPRSEAARSPALHSNCNLEEVERYD